MKLRAPLLTFSSAVGSRNRRVKYTGWVLLPSSTASNIKQLRTVKRREVKKVDLSGEEYSTLVPLTVPSGLPGAWSGLDRQCVGAGVQLQFYQSRKLVGQ
jgi:hypothetical protein